MTDDQRDIIVGLIRNTIDYLHKQEVLLIQLAGTIEMEKEHPEPTPAEEIAREADEFYKQMEKAREQYPFPWGHNLGKTADEERPGLTHIVSETTNIVEKPMPTPIRDAMVNGPGEPPRGALE
jgi:hypothetical protein